MLKKAIYLILVLAFFSADYGFAEASVNLEKVTFKNPAQPYEQIITGGQPSKEDLIQLKQLGVKNVVNLRTSGEFDQFDQAEVLKELRLNYITLEVAGAAGVNLENASKLNDILTNLQGKTFVHCASSNRVGALFAVIANRIQGKTIEQAMEEGKSAGMKSLTDKTRSLLNELSQ